MIGDSASESVAGVVRQVMCAVVAEVVCALVAQMMPATNCGTAAEMVAAMVSRTKTGTLVPTPGGTPGARDAGARTSARSAEAWRRSSLAIPNQAWMELSGTSARVTRRLARSGLTPHSGLAPGNSIGPCQARLSAKVVTRRRWAQNGKSRRGARGAPASLDSRVLSGIMP